MSDIPQEAISRMELRHTPGPWAVEILKEGAIALGHARTGGGLETLIFYEDTQGYKPEAVARSVADFTLAAAAPDLLEAGSRLIAVFDQQKMTAAERIIVGISDAGLKTEGNAAIEALRAAIAKATDARALAAAERL